MTKEQKQSDAFDRVYKNKRAKGLTMHCTPCENYNCCNEAGFNDDMITIRTALNEHAALKADNARLRDCLTSVKNKSIEIEWCDFDTYNVRKEAQGIAKFIEQALKGQDNDTE